MPSGLDPVSRTDSVDGASTVDDMVNLNASNNTRTQAYDCRNYFKLYYDSSSQPHKMAVVSYTEPSCNCTSQHRDCTGVEELCSWHDKKPEGRILTDTTQPKDIVFNDDIEVLIMMCGGEIKVKVVLSDEPQELAGMGGTVLASTTSKLETCKTTPHHLQLVEFMTSEDKEMSPSGQPTTTFKPSISYNGPTTCKQNIHEAAKITSNQAETNITTYCNNSEIANAQRNKSIPHNIKLADECKTNAQKTDEELLSDNLWEQSDNEILKENDKEAKLEIPLKRTVSNETEYRFARKQGDDRKERVQLCWRSMSTPDFIPQKVHGFGDRLVGRHNGAGSEYGKVKILQRPSTTAVNDRELSQGEHHDHQKLAEYTQLYTDAHSQTNENSYARKHVSMESCDNILKHSLVFYNKDFNKTDDCFQYHGTGDNVAGFKVAGIINQGATRSALDCDHDFISYMGTATKDKNRHNDVTVKTCFSHGRLGEESCTNRAAAASNSDQGHTKTACTTLRSTYSSNNADSNKNTRNESKRVNESKSIDETDYRERINQIVSNAEQKFQERKMKKRRNKNKSKSTKTQVEVLQKQIAAGLLKSMFGPCKSNSLKSITLQGTFHEGTYATKYKATHQKQTVVLSVYSDQDTSDIDTDRMSRLRNSNLVNVLKDSIIGAGQDLWLLHSYYPLGSLHDLIRRDPKRHVIGEMHAQFVTCGIVMGLEYLLKHKIVHGNIKPSKILLSQKGYPILTGFLTVRPVVGEDTRAVFTPAYAAPERFRGNLEPGVDIFSVGCLAYQLVTGRTPFDGNSMEETKMNILQADYRPFYKAELFSLSGELFIDSCLRKLVHERFQLRENESNLQLEEWFSTLDLSDMKQQRLPSPLLQAVRQIEAKVQLDNDDKTVSYNWGQIMDVVCPNRPTLIT